ncbi:MAG TPA: alpha/beta hydrolase-fold protein [Actinomycetota bacterium]|nr:alpha/beta hydrolase-fold protein [Actinomycetota bacterium]
MKRGTVVRPVLESALLRGNPLGDPADRITPVYLPPSYEEQPGRRYPLILAITGFMGNGRMHLNESFLDDSLDARLDRLIDSGAMGEAIVVMVDAMTRYGGSQFVDSSATGPYGRYVIEEVIPWADATFRTIPHRDARGIFGKSSGGYGSIRLAMDHPDVLGAFACHSGDMAFEYCYLTEWPKTLRYLWHNDLTPKQFLDTFRERLDRGEGYFSTLNDLAMASCYSPDPGSDLGFDLPFDLETGEVIDEVWQRWLAHDPVRIIDERVEALRSQRLVFIDCGKKDEWFLDVGARWAVSKIHSLGIDVVHEEFDAGHMSIPYRYDRSLPLLTKALLPPEG